MKVKNVWKIRYHYMRRNAKRWRVQNLISQRDIAEKAGCATNLICQFEMGNNDSAEILLVYMEEGFNPNEEY